MIQIGASVRIIISTRIVGVGASRFSIAHEIAHLLLYLKDGDLGRAFKRQCTCSPLAGDGSEIERDASVFATELLMPAPLVTPMCRVAPRHWIRFARSRARSRPRCTRARGDSSS